MYGIRPIQQALFLLLLISTAFISGCKPSQTVVVEDNSSLPKTTDDLSDDDQVRAWIEQQKQAETAVPAWVQEPGPYRPQRTKAWDLIHTELHITPLMRNRQLMGKALLTVAPHFYLQDSISIDAVNMLISKVGIVEGTDTINLDASKYRYTGEDLIVYFTRKYHKGEPVTVLVHYTTLAMPQVPLSTDPDDRGIYFNNPTGDIPYKPIQVWTQGETENSSRWFPTLDNPVYKTTSDIYVTTDKAFKTFSNGTLKKTTPVGTNLKTDHWSFGKASTNRKTPHTPYLFALVIGDYEIVQDRDANVSNRFGKSVPVYYYVEPGYKASAKAVFGNTPEMIEFFSKKLSYNYPWENYKQITVRDFVSGAMENTTATIHYELLSVDERSIKDAHQDDIIAHELFHHWFGDLVTCESWAQLPLNESFATYSEYLWREYKYGKASADLHRSGEYRSYMREAKNKRVPLIRYNYLDKENMFDSHSYAKGSLILHMLRKKVGDDAFFAALNYYLHHHEFQTTEIHDLRLAFEEVTGMDLKLFFDQWFLGSGHPEFRAYSSWEDGQLEITLNQVQNSTYSQVFQVDIPVEIHVGGKVLRKTLNVNDQYFTQAMAMDQEPDLVLIDPEHIIPAVYDHVKSTDAFIYQFSNSPSVLARGEALNQLASGLDEADILSVFEKALKDSVPAIREQALIALTDYRGDKSGLKSAIESLALKDKSPSVRAEAVRLYTEWFKDKSWLNQRLKDPSYLVWATVLESKDQLKEPIIPAMLIPYEKAQDPGVQMLLADYFSYLKVPGKNEWYQKNIVETYPYYSTILLPFYGAYLTSFPQYRASGLDYLMKLVEYDSHSDRKITAFRVLKQFDRDDAVKAKLESVVRKETNPKIQEVYQRLGY